MPMSRFIQNYKPRLDEAARNDDLIVLEQRGGQPSFVLETERRASASQQANEFVAGALSALLADQSLERAFVARLSATLPWVDFLPEDDRIAFVEDVVGTLRACASINRYTAFAEMLDDWKNTAEIYSDPELVAALSEDVTEPLGLPLEAATSVSALSAMRRIDGDSIDTLASRLGSASG